MHHIHMSTGFAFIVTLFVLGLLAVIFAFIVSIRRDNARAREHREWLNRTSDTSQSSAFRSTSHGTAEPGYATNAPRAGAPGYAAAAPVTVMHNGGGSDLLTGMLVGSMMNNHGGGNTYINEAPTTYEAPESSGFTYDSGSSGGGDSGGGFDCGGGGD